MLAAANRLRHSREFQSTVRRGVRVGRPLVVVHLIVDPRDAGPPRAGFVVSGRVGGAVVRNAVRRRLRHLMVDRLSLLPSGARVVVRANPGAAEAPSSALAKEIDEALARALDRREARL